MYVIARYPDLAAFSGNENLNYWHLLVDLGGHILYSITLQSVSSVYKVTKHTVEMKYFKSVPQTN